MEARVVDVRIRLFGAENDSAPISYANPLRAWHGAHDAEDAYRFPEWLVVEVELDTGHVGLGNAGLAPRLAASIVDAYLKPVVLGARVADLESTWQRMYRSIVAFGRKGVGMVAISAVDLALWDAHARALGVPVYDLLGGKTTDTIRAYGSRLYGGEDLDALAAEAREFVAAGFTAIKQRFIWGPADGAAGMRRNVELVAAVRNAIGDRVELMADAYMGWDFDYARRMLPLLEPYGLRWLEEPLLPDDIQGYAELRARSPIPIAGGEHEFTVHGFADLFRRQAVDIAQPDMNRVGGLTQGRKICALAEAAGVQVVPHAGQQHNYHLVISQPACPLAEYFPPGNIDVGNELPHRLFSGEPAPIEGHITLSTAPGFGLALAPQTPVRELTAAAPSIG
jgi:L-rhamnonate dehydratase